MNEQEYKTQQTTNAIQKDLENQLRMFGASVADGVFNGFDGRGQELGARARGVGDAFAHVVENEVRAALYPDQAQNKNDNAQGNSNNPYQYDFEKARQNGGYQPNRAPRQRSILSRFQKKPSYEMERAAGRRTAVGVVQLLLGFIFGASTLLGGLICLLVGALVGGDVGFVAIITGLPLTLVGLALSAPILFGFKNLGLAKRMKRYVAEFGEGDTLALAQLVESSGYKRDDVLKDIRKIMQKNLCPFWFEDRQQTMYLSLETYQQAKAELAAVRAAKQGTQNVEGHEALLESITGFIAVLGKQKEIMQEQDAVAELDRMQETCRDIYDWVKLHPEAAPKMRRFTSYYMPTTLKLLYSYNDVQGQQGENAQTIRRDIGRFLHTLNTAFDNLHDNLLSSVSLDVSSEIAALQGMLAQDGLSVTDDFKVEPTLEL